MRGTQNYAFEIAEMSRGTVGFQQNQLVVLPDPGALSSCTRTFYYAFHNTTTTNNDKTTNNNDTDDNYDR